MLRYKLTVDTIIEVEDPISLQDIWDGTVAVPGINHAEELNLEYIENTAVGLKSVS